MRKITAIFILIITTLELFAQTGNIRGKVTDEKKTPLAFASIYVINATDSSNVMGAVTNEAGQFIVENLPYKKYLIRFKIVGFADKWTVAEPTSLNPTVSLGLIIMTETGKDLKEVEIGAERKLIENNIDKKTFTVDKSIISQSGSAVDALEQIPLITTDENGNLQLRGSDGILILINGKPTGLRGDQIQTILKQIHANSIDKI